MPINIRTVPSSWKATRSDWPEMCGFSIVGNGPSYVISVERDSAAHQAGLCPGDHLVNLDGHNISDMSAEAIIALGRHSGNEPPTLGVVSRVQFLELAADRRWGYGMKLKGVKPTVVESIDPPGPAYKAGVRPGDIVLEIEGHRIRKLELADSILREKFGSITLAMIAVGNNGGPRFSREQTPTHADLARSRGSRVRKARDLFSKMNSILGDDFERKMALVGVLKQYAERRNIETFSSAVSILLSEPKHETLIKEIRSVVPLKHRSQFDALLNRKPSPGGVTENQPRRWYNDLTEPRIFIIQRVDGSFGFVLVGHNPVCIESVLTGGPADRAGLRPGDAIIKLNGIDVRKCSHEYLVKLLQDSGESPKLEVFQGGHGLSEDQDGVNRSSSSLSSDNSDSSPDRITDWFSDAKSPSDSVQNKFQMQVDHLLTRHEKSYMRRTLMRFREDRNISHLVDHMKTILDSEAKQMLWKFLLPRLSEDHQKYVLQNAGISKYLLDDISNVDHIDNLPRMRKNPIQNEEFKDSPESADDATLSSSFQNQLGFLLTSRERSQLKKALQIYAERRNINHLVEDLIELLDTPSKSVLWNHIIPLLSTNDQKYCQKFISLPPHTASSGRSIQSSRFLPAETPPATPRKGDVLYETQISSRKPKHLSKQQGQRNFKSTNRSNGAQRDNRLREINNRGAYGESESTDDSSDESTRRSSGFSFGQTKSFHVQPPRTIPSTAKKVYEDNGAQMRTSNEWNTNVTNGGANLSRRSPAESAKSKVKMVRESSAQTTPLHQTTSGQRQLNMHNRSAVAPNSPAATGDFRTVVKVGDDRPIDVDMASVYSDRTGSGMPTSESTRRIIRGSASHNAVAAAGSNEKPFRRGSSGDEAKDTAKGSANISRSSSFQIQAQNVLRAFDDIVEEEETNGAELRVTPYINVGHGSGLYSPLPGVPPPPPPPPPLPPLSAMTESNGTKPFGLAVKRINWEKLEKVDENTVWAKIGDGEDLEDVVKYLELEQKFSTKRTTISESFKDRKTEVSILSPKKAYNISILLGQTKMSVANVKQALLSLDERILSPELLNQLLAYAPDSDEMEKYDEYRGLLDDLGKADQFIYQISRVPGYIHRLQAMLFKANFAEKVEEVKQSLRVLKKASQELLQSQKMAKILELVLAMGNYMNKGNTRIGDAPGFRIAFLSQLDLTKTSNGESTFLHVLADAVQSRFPDVFNLAEDLPSVGEACKVSDVHLTEELSELRKVLQEISNTVNKMTNQKQRAGNNDRFHDVMGHFISDASDEMQGLFSLHASAVEEFHRVVQYFGENPKDLTSVEFFTIFGEFLSKFEKARQRNQSSHHHPGRHLDNRPSPRTK